MEDGFYPSNSASDAASESDKKGISSNCVIGTGTPQEGNDNETERGAVPADRQSDESQSMSLTKKFRNGCGALVNHRYTTRFIFVLIGLNAIDVGLYTFDYIQDKPVVMDILYSLNYFALVIFTLEIILQAIFLNPVKLVRNPWLAFDLMIVLFSWTLEGIESIQTLRVLRMLRLGLKIKGMRRIVAAMIKVAPNLRAIAMLMALIVYIYAVIGVLLFGKLYQLGVINVDYFSTLDKSFLTMMQLMTLGWSRVARPVMAYYPASTTFFVSFVFLSGLIAYNAIIAVVCDSVALIEHMSKVKSRKKELEQSEKAKKKRKSHCHNQVNRCDVYDKDCHEGIPKRQSRYESASARLVLDGFSLPENDNRIDCLSLSNSQRTPENVASTRITNYAKAQKMQEDLKRLIEIQTSMTAALDQAMAAADNLFLFDNHSTQQK